MTTVAIVGAAHIHTPAFIRMLKQRADVRTRYVWDHDSARAQRRADELGCKVVSDPAQIWADPEVNAVAICSETDRHEPLVMAATSARKHLFVEKPLGIGAGDAYRMASAIEAAGVIFQTGYFQRGDAKNLFLRHHVQAGTFGRITRMRGSNCHSGALGGWFDTEWRWMADPKQAGVGAFGDLGTHTLDLMLWMLGPVQTATAMLDNVTARYPGCDETGEGLMRFKSGAIGTLAAAWADVANPVYMLISGTEGHGMIVNGQVYLESKKVEGADGKTPMTNLPPGWPHAFELFLDAVVGKPNVPLVGAREAAYRSAVMEAMYKGAAQGTWVSPQE